MNKLSIQLEVQGPADSLRDQVEAVMRSLFGGDGDDGPHPPPPEPCDELPPGMMHLLVPEDIGPDGWATEEGGHIHVVPPGGSVQIIPVLQPGEAFYGPPHNQVGPAGWDPDQ